jgi:hypothetical protein
LVYVLEAGELEAAAGEAVAERLGDAVARAPPGGLRLAGVHQRLEEGAGGEDDGGGAVEDAAARGHATNAE